LINDFYPIEASLFNSSSVVLHTAGIVGNEAVVKDINISRKINIDGTKKLAGISRDNDISKFIYV
jgi:nucleoside-diphosphate-sugar epimerase